MASILCKLLIHKHVQLIYGPGNKLTDSVLLCKGYAGYECSSMERKSLKLFTMMTIDEDT